ncbi:MAG: undecaprenyl-diphosphate phosphatase [Candidatus Gastranaerophilales bacterium]|nr:undecaprenyl-diphosphate phosphatase [Candidatus Gastranaerophilales bacterium]
MNLIQSVLMGIVQGLSEFLPVSSSAHLVFTSNFYKVFKNIPIAEQSTEEVFLDIMLHLGTLIAVLIFFRKDVMEITKALFMALKKWDFSSHLAKLGLYIIAGTFVTIILALPFNEIANHLVFHPALVGGLLIITGGVLFLSEYLAKKKPSTSEVGLKQALLIGLAQGLAVLPGFSRSGWTIATGLFTGLDRQTAARYSFLLSIPIILGASMVYPLVKIDVQDAVSYNWYSIIIGTIVSGIVGYLCIKYFMKFISKFSLNIFGWYCIIMGIFTLIFFNVFK